MTAEPCTPTLPAPAPAVPRGWSVYLDRRIRGWDASALASHADRCRRYRIRTVMLCAEAVDGYVAPHDVLRRVADVYRDAGACRVGLYALHGAAAVREPVAAARRLAAATEATQATIAQLDAEEPWRGHGDALYTCRQVLTDSVTERVALSVSTYGYPGAVDTPDGYPWRSILGWGWLGWQVYETSADRARVRKRLDGLRAHWGRSSVLPAVATYRRKGQTPEGVDGALRLRGDAMRVALAEQGDISSCDVPGLALWSDATLDAREGAVLLELADAWSW